MTKEGREGFEREAGVAEHCSSAQCCLRLPLRMIMTMGTTKFCKLNVALGDYISYLGN